jgi:hypothetical protein
VLVETPQQREGLRQLLKCEYPINRDKLIVDINTVEENKFNVPPNTVLAYLRMALSSNPLVGKIQEMLIHDQAPIKASLLILPVTLQYSSTTGEYNINKIIEPVGTYIAADEFRQVLKASISVGTSVSNQVNAG